MYARVIFSHRDKIGAAKNSVRVHSDGGEVFRRGTKKFYDNLRRRDFIEIDGGGMRSLTGPR